MGTWITINNFIGSGKSIFTPNALNPVFWLKDLTTPVNGYWKDYSGKNKQIQAATTTVANDSLIMPANDTDIINALTALGVYSKYYTNNSTPKTVLISQVASIDANYRVFFDAKNKKNFTLFGSAGNEYRADKMYKYTFNAYTGGYFPITQTSDSISFIIRGTGTFVFDWGDGTTNSYTLSTGSDTTVSKTWSTNLGGQKNITVTGNVKNWTKLVFNGRSTDNSIFRITGMALTYLQLANCPLISVTGSITGMALTYLQLYNCPLISVTGSITGMALTYLSLYSCALISVTGSITGMALTYLVLYNRPLSNIIGNIETCSVSSSIINVQQSGITYGGGALKAWAISITIQAAWTSTMVDDFLIAFALVAPTVTGKTLNLAGTNAGRTPASAAAVTTIQNKGFNVLTN